MTRKNPWWSDSVDANSLRCMQKNLGWLPKHAELGYDKRGYIVAEWSNMETTFLPTGQVVYMAMHGTGVRCGVASNIGGVI